MSVRSFPRTKEKPKKRILLIPVILLFGGFGLMQIHPDLRFIGIILALTGSLVIFLVGMVFADLWIAAHRTEQMMKQRAERHKEENEMNEDYDPFEDELER